jgi:hypothetical protein
MEKEKKKMENKRVFLVNSELLSINIMPPSLPATFSMSQAIGKSYTIEASP